MTMQLIRHINLSAAQSSITFTSIPQTYTDLYIVASLRNTETGNWSHGFIRPNNDSANTTVRILYGTGTGVASASYSTGDFYVSTNGNTANTFGNGDWYFPNYTSNQAKSFSGNFVSETNGSTAIQVIESGLWNSTSAITSLTLFSNAGNFVQFSSATLYGITAGTDGTTTVS